MLPIGTVTFLFSDIQGSTQLVQKLGDDYPRVLDEHQRLLREAFAMYDGMVVDMQGDSFFVAFPRALDAISAAAAAQRALYRYEWGEDLQVSVRMGLHTGEPTLVGERYVGMDVHRAARIGSAGYGGQVLVSETTQILVKSDLPQGVTLRDLGEHRLKDLRTPKRLYQLVVAELPSEFPPLKTLDATPNNLPVQLTSFVGREKEIENVKRQLTTGRIVTLTGSGGSGKTRLSLQVAGEVFDHFHEGVWFIELAPLADGELVPQTIATVLHLREQPGEPIGDTLTNYLRDKHILLVLDNCEHLIEACARLADHLLHACRHLKILASSREGLGIAGEIPYRVPSLSLPSLSNLQSPGSDLQQYEAVRLFIDRAVTLQPTFTVNNQNAPAVAQICSRLDGIPLALELAAARIKVLNVEQIAKKLDDRFRLLTGGSRTALPRHQTLRAAIDWSYDLLSEPERVLLRRLSVFAGRWTLVAAESVCADESMIEFDILDVLTNLVDKSLVIVEAQPGEARYGMLETVRQYGQEKLIKHLETAKIRTRHLYYFCEFSERAEPWLRRPEQSYWLNQLDAEHDNLRSALDWSVALNELVETGLRLASALAEFWRIRGYFSEGREELGKLFAHNKSKGQTPTHAKGLAGAAWLAYRQSDYPAAIALAQESLHISERSGDKRGMIDALTVLGTAVFEEGDYEVAVGLMQQQLELNKELHDLYGTGRALIHLGWAALRPGDYGNAGNYLEQALELAHNGGHLDLEAWAISGLGEIALRRDEYPRATLLLEESLTKFRQVGETSGIAASLGTLAWVSIKENDWQNARLRLDASLQTRREMGDLAGTAWCLERFADIAVANMHLMTGVQLLGAAETIRMATRSVIDRIDRSVHEETLSHLRARLGDVQFTKLWNTGRALTTDQAIALASAGGV